MADAAARNARRIVLLLTLTALLGGAAGAVVAYARITYPPLALPASNGSNGGSAAAGEGAGHGGWHEVAAGAAGSMSTRRAGASQSGDISLPTQGAGLIVAPPTQRWLHRAQRDSDGALLSGDCAYRLRFGAQLGAKWALRAVAAGAAADAAGSSLREESGRGAARRRWVSPTLWAAAALVSGSTGGEPQIIEVGVSAQPMDSNWMSVPRGQNLWLELAIFRTATADMPRLLSQLPAIEKIQCQSR